MKSRLKRIFSRKDTLKLPSTWYESTGDDLPYLKCPVISTNMMTFEFRMTLGQFNGN